MIAVLTPYAELPSGTAIRTALKWQAVGLLLLACHVVLTRWHVSLFVVVPCLLGWVYLNAPLAGLLIYFQFLIYQNWMIALLSVGMASTNFTVLQGTNFAVIVILAFIASGRLLVPMWKRENHVWHVMLMVAFALVASATYGVFGAAIDGPQSAAVYFREFTCVAFAAVVGLDVGRAWGFKTVALGLLVTVMLSLAIAGIEIIYPAQYYDWINAANFGNLKASCCLYKLSLYGPADVIEQNTSSFFNISGNETNASSYRFMSASMHSISYAYVLAVAGLLAISIYRSFWLILIIPLMLLIGVKGAALLFAFSAALWVVWQAGRSGMATIVCGLLLMSAYIAWAIVHGMEVQDFHVIGFLGGVHGFLNNPLGHGLGVGGNLSAVAEKSASGVINWTGSGGFQNAGADFALESAVGVLIYQMGIGAVAIFAVFIALMKAAPFFHRQSLPQRHDLWFISLAVVMINGVFQEEAYAPTAAGLIALLCAIVLINQNRQAASLTRDATFPLAAYA